MKKNTILFLIILISGLFYGQDKTVTKYIRRNANTAEAQADLEAMNTAFKKCGKWAVRMVLPGIIRARYIIFQK